MGDSREGWQVACIRLKGLRLLHHGPDSFKFLPVLEVAPLLDSDNVPLRVLLVVPLYDSVLHS